MLDLKSQIRDLSKICDTHDEAEKAITAKETAMRTSSDVEASIHELQGLYAKRDLITHDIAEQVRLLATPRVLAVPATTHDKIIATLAEGGQVHRAEIAKVCYPKLTIEKGKKRASTKLDQMKRKKEVAQVPGFPGVWKLGSRAVHDGVNGAAQH